MNWFLFAVSAPILFSISNHIDKYLLSRFIKNNGVASLMIFSSFFSILLLPIILLFGVSVFNVGFFSTSILIFAGLLSGFAIYLYLTALNQTDASNVVPIFQTIPIFGFIVAYLILKETIPADKIIASLLIISGSISISIEKNSQGKFSVAKKVLLLMLTSSFLYACYDTLFKLIALEENFWVSTFWQIVGLFIFGLFLFISSKNHRSNFISLVKENSFKILALNAINEVINLTGTLLLAFATLLAPIALVTTVGTYQPVFVLIIGFLITKIFPEISKEDMSKFSIFKKILSISIILLGTLLLYR